MRILHIDTGAELRGGQRQALLLMQGLRAAGHESVLLCLADSPLCDAARVAEFAVYSAGLLSIRAHSGRVEMVHAHDAHAHSLAALAVRNPFVVSRRVAFPVGRSLASRWKYQRPARFLAVSQFVAGQLRNAGVAPQKIDVVFDGVEAASTAAKRAGLASLCMSPLPWMARSAI